MSYFILNKQNPFSPKFMKHAGIQYVPWKLWICKLQGDKANYKFAIAAATPEDLTCFSYNFALSKAVFNLTTDLKHLIGNNSINGL